MGEVHKTLRTGVPEHRMETPFFGSLVIAYLFLGGASAGAFFVMSAWSLGFYCSDTAARHHMRLRSAFKALKGRVYTISLIILAVSLVCLVFDLQYPDRALLLFFRPRPTPMTFGAYALAVEAILGLLLALANVFKIPFLDGRVKRVLEVLCAVCSIAVMGYTGMLLANQAAVPLWHEWSLVALFFFSALSSGVSVVLLIDYFIQGQTLLLRAARPLQKAHLACLVLEGVSLAFFVHATLTKPTAANSVALLMDPTMLSTAVVGVIGMGILVPFALELNSLMHKDCRTIPVSDVICLIGSFCLRYCVVVCGVH